ncbi:glucose-6-phosphate dehydrogenase [Belliella marina]|uniref:Glucose-6-phosphate 1-dehydrogenase n=1 Tax=Belliella marina TaxID=1644146 RepID=A0ABW4VL04_9BACT
MKTKTEKKTEPTIIIVFGGTGDLSKRKLIPAFYNLFLDGWMPDKLAIYGLGRSEMDNESFQIKLFDGLSEFSRSGVPEPESWEKFKKNLNYLPSNINDQKSYKELLNEIEELEEEWGQRANRLYYLSVAPKFIETVCRNLKSFKLVDDQNKDRIIIEKPFGYDKDSAISLNKMLQELFDEDQIFRIDHYLGKETVQNILAFRFANTLFEPLWNRNYIDYIQITVAEDVGIGDRGGYYEGAGALRDMIQNHLLQILCMIAMEPPVTFEAEEIRNRKVDVLKAIRRIPIEEVHNYAVRGQYASGWIKGKEVLGYRDENDTNRHSQTETFAAIKFYIDNWRWQDVPVYLRTGKRMQEKTSSINIQFRPVPHMTFPTSHSDNLTPNRLTINIQPHMDIKLRFMTKKTGLEMNLNSSEMIFNYDSCSTQSPEAYETLLLDAMLGDTTLFMRSDQVEEAWDVLSTIQQAWEKGGEDFPNYVAGSWGPEKAEALIARQGHFWTMDIKKNDKQK